MGERFEFVARAIIVRNGKFLLCRPAQKPWHFFPGGHVEFGEKAEKALRREFWKELNMRLEEIELVGVAENCYERDGERHHEINLVFHAEMEDGEVSSSEDHMSFDWIDFQSFSEKEIYPLELRDAVSDWKRTGQFFRV